MNSQNHIINLIQGLDEMDLDEKINAINKIKIYLHEKSPFKSEPVDCVIWEKNENVIANDYNPNSVAPPEMELLELSIMNDGYTQPIVAWPNKDKLEIVDGFHRNRVGRESKVVGKRIHGYLPVVAIRKEQQGKNDRIASTIRHNRARGKHQVDAMSEIVIELKNRNWRNKRIARELGMDEQEVLRLLQITGLQEMFKDDDFSRAWVASDSPDFEPVSYNVTEEELDSVRVANVSDESRIFHTFDKWECAKAGLYKSKHGSLSNEECEQAYLDILGSPEKFEAALKRVTSEWVNSCEHYLTNAAMNRIAWLGQASVCIETGAPSSYAASFFKLSDKQQEAANLLAFKYLNEWLTRNGMPEVSYESALSKGRQVNIY